MARSNSKKIKWLLIVILAIPLIASAFYFLNGSLESFPTQDQQDQVRLFAGLSFLILAILESAVIGSLIFRRSKSQQ